jgi:hypothetical protein
MSTSTIAYPPKRLRVSSGSNSSSPLNVKPKFSLDSVKDSAIVKRVISPSSGPRLRKTKSRRSIRTRKSKLDMLDNRHLTSFPLEPPKIGGGSDTESICIVEDYIPQNVQPTKEEEDATGEEPHCMLWPCVGCLKELKVQRRFIRQNTSFACEACMQTSLTSATANVVRIDPCGWEADPYFIMEQGIEWYSTLRKTFRWRWRIKGLI